MNKKNLLKINLLSIFLVASCTTPTTTSPVGSSSPTPTVSPSSDNTSVNPTPSGSPNNQASVSPSVNPSSSPSNGGQVNTGTTLNIASNFLKLSYNDYYSAELKWTQMTGAKSYKIYQDGKLIADNLTGSMYNVTNLRPNTDYSFDIVAVNDAGESNKSNLKVRTFIPSSNSSSNNYNYNNNDGYYPIPTPTPTVAPVLTRLYVNPLSAGGLNNGSTWANAYTNLQNALRVATSGQEIWVATGIYYTSTQNSGNRSASFVIPAGVKVYGGFAGNETSLGERTDGQNPTVLSGDFQQDDIDPVNTFNTSAFRIKELDPRQNNSYHVVTISDQVSNSSTIDSFTIERGHADNEISSIVDGAGMYINNASPVISNILFNRNFSHSNGGAIYKTGTGNLNISRSKFQINTSQTKEGGAIFVNSGETIISESSFNNNLSFTNGGAISFGSNIGAINISNTSFTSNASGNGGAIYIPTMSTSTISDSSFIFGTTFSMNTAQNGGAIYLSNTELTLTKYIFNSNSASNNGGAIYLTNSTLIGKNNSFNTNTAVNSGNIIYALNSVLVDNNGNMYNGSSNPVGNDIVSVNN